MTILRLMNKYEEIVFDTLYSRCDHDTHVFAKVRLADVFSIINSGISSEEYSFCLKAHFDFVVVDKNHFPLFSVEYDGKQHTNDNKQIKNDSIKDKLCEKFNFPILRIKSNHINKKFKGIDLLSYFIDAWFLSKSFYEAQENGLIPYEEDFDQQFIYSIDNGKKWPYWLSSELQIEIQNLHRANKIYQPVPSRWIGEDENGNYKCISWIKVNEKKVVFIKTGMKAQFFPVINESDILSMISVFDLYKEIEMFLNGLSMGHESNVFENIFKEFRTDLKLRRCSGYGHTIS